MADDVRRLQDDFWELCHKFYRAFMKLILDRDNVISSLKEQLREKDVLILAQKNFFSDTARAVEQAKEDASRRESDCLAQIMRLSELSRNRLIKNFGMSVNTDLFKGSDGIYFLKHVSVVLEPRLILNAFCRILHVSEDDLFGMLDDDIAERLSEAKESGQGVAYLDEFSDIGGKLFSNHQCRMKKGEENG